MIEYCEKCKETLHFNENDRTYGCINPSCANFALRHWVKLINEKLEIKVKA